MEYVAPQFSLSAFNCPICGAYAQQLWTLILPDTYYDERFRFSNPNTCIVPTEIKRDFGTVYTSRCWHCYKEALWVNKKMIYPSSSIIPHHSNDMPEDIAKIYNEAASIYTLSPRSAAALLRLALQMLLIHLGEKGNNINQDIKNLVAKGLPPMVQQAADIIRHVGNEAVHPGTIDFNDNSDTSATLFQILNWIVYYMITIPKNIQSMYHSLPDNIQKSIEMRDKNGKSPAQISQ